MLYLYTKSMTHFTNLFLIKQLDILAILSEKDLDVIKK